MVGTTNYYNLIGNMDSKALDPPVFRAYT